MKLGEPNIDEIDRRILAELQLDCKAPLAQVGKRVGLSAPSVMERIRKLEQAGVIAGYHAQLDSRKVGLDVTAFIGVSTSSTGISELEDQIESFEEVLECHHVTGSHTMLLKVKTVNTQVNVSDPPPQKRGIAPGQAREPVRDLKSDVES
jgi:Lrp/AsnC family leucine-responsive transcriptional regulator